MRGAAGKRFAYVAAAVLAVVFASLPAAALATPGWTPPRNYVLPSSALAGGTQIAYQSGGTATIAWLEVISSSTPVHTVLHAGVIAPGGPYHEQLRIESASTSAPGGAYLAVAPNGAAALSWAVLQGASTSQPYSYAASYRPAGSSTWEAPATLATDTAKSSVGTGVFPAISDNGTAAVAIDRVDTTLSPTGAKIDVAVHPAGGAWGTVTQMAQGAMQPADNPMLGFDAHGNLTVAFTLGVPGSTGHTLGDQRWSASSGVWSSFEDITKTPVGDDVKAPMRLAVGPDGSAVLAYTYKHASTSDATAATRSGTAGTWTAATDLSPGGSGISSAPLGVAVAPDGKAYVLFLYSGTSTDSECVAAVRAPAGGTFTAKTCVSAGAYLGSGGQVALIGNDAYLVWTATSDPGGKDVVQASRWPRASAQPQTFTDLDNLRGSLNLIEASGDGDGSVAAFWTLSGTTLRVAAFDAGGPILLSANVPPALTAGQDTPMSAAFTDLWSGVPGEAWTFGDGGTGDGPLVTHAYTASGNYTVTITASDGLGNPTTVSYPVVVSAPVVPATAPLLTKVGQSASRWRRGSKLPRYARVRKPPLGTTFTLTLDKAAKVSFAFMRRTAGRRVSGRCVSATKRNARKPRCTRSAPAGTLSFAAHAGVNKLTFQGRLSKSARLPAGDYSVAITATAAGKSSPPRTLTFTIVG
jgi:PKD repeat protein